jgi:DNA-binding transcriptional MerR regulator
VVDYTIREAADALSVDPRTLRRWVRIAGMEPAINEAGDARFRLLSREQVLRLAWLHKCSVAGLTGETIGPEEDLRLATLSRSVRSLTHKAARDKNELAELRASMRSLREVVESLVESTNRISARLDAVETATVPLRRTRP